MIRKESKDTLTYLKKVKTLGILGIIVSIALIAYDIIMYEGILSIISLVIDGVLFVFSIYFIIKSNKLKEREKVAIEKIKKEETNDVKATKGKKNLQKKVNTKSKK